MPEARTPRLPDDCRPLRDAVARGEVRMSALARGHYPGTPLPPGRLPGLMSAGYWDAVGPQTWGLPMHRNEGVEICCLIGGEVAFATDHESASLRPGDITITRPWQRHRLGDPAIRACRLFWVILDVGLGSGRGGWELPPWVGPDRETRREFLRVLRRNQRCLVREGGEGLRSYLSGELEGLAQPGPLRFARAASLINHLITHVVGILSGEHRARSLDPHGFNQTVRSFFLGLESDVAAAAEPWTVAGMARSCRVGVTYFTASCRQIFNATPSEHLCRIRLAHAARLLRGAPAMTVTDVAFACGFNSSQYFATRFRKQFRQAPMRYRGAAG